MAAYANVPTRPTNSSNALSERFIGLLSLGSAEYSPGVAGSSAWGIIHKATQSGISRNGLA